MDLIAYYRRQYSWRHWRFIYDQLPPVRDRILLDLGCGIGDQSADLAAYGARVIGIDGNADVISVATARALPGCQFFQSNLRALPSTLPKVDGLWSSFVAAYFPAFVPVLRGWLRHLRPGGWVAFTEIDDLFAHAPLDASTRRYLSGYCAEAFSAGRYHFHMGRDLVDHMRSAGLRVLSTFDVPDDEFSRSGPVTADVADAWMQRLDGMTLLRDYCGSAFPRVRGDFMTCITSTEHQSASRVRCVVAEWLGAD